jgi:hypothetical protein
VILQVISSSDRDFFRYSIAQRRRYKDSIRGQVMSSWIAIGAGAVISVMVLMWLVKVIKATIQTAVVIAAIVFALNFFGIGPGNVVKLVFDFLMNVLFGIKA